MAPGALRGRLGTAWARVTEEAGAVAHRVREDIDAAIDRDPATDSRLEMALASPGLHAVWAHRVSHAMWTRGARLPARLLSQASRAMTGIEIHPGAQVGRRLFIDHGMGVVIGETAEVGDDVMMYHAVTLGGRANAKIKRHPTVESGAVLGAGARLLGPIVVGKDAQVGANAVVVKDVPSRATAVGVPAVNRVPKGERAEDAMFADPALWI
ncbi:serine O-acetyltransferase [Ornithinimicrobium sp. F0845]|uniref:serine O-acetyltransferase EpsC n=1 Tax=Ornithinimicrobium sp. F0845 TaxID=2926412 RepID=UPI001FF35CB1|nr:serine O-acetyltransferase EpsC [Ornithinimicrobium sp. F0845]MCK0111983.1 serine O-acetyltransferase [Ornithinimicrobium sp. F0845]